MFMMKPGIEDRTRHLWRLPPRELHELLECHRYPRHAGLHTGADDENPPAENSRTTVLRQYRGREKKVCSCGAGADCATLDRVSWEFFNARERAGIARFKDMLPFLIPVIILELVLMLVALLDLLRREKIRGNKWVWLAVIVLFQIVGPILYLIVGREE